MAEGHAEIGTQRTAGRMAGAVVLTVLVVVTFAVRAAWFGDPNADIDEQLYSLIGLEMTRGALPFVDLWDRKPIGLFAIFAFAHAIGGPGPAAYQVLAALFTLAGAWMTYRLGLAIVDRVTAAAGGVLYVFLMSIYGSHSAQSEAFWVPMMLGMALLVRDQEREDALKRALAAMLLGGLALQVKYTALPQCAFFGIWALWGQYRKGVAPRRLLALAAAFAGLGLAPTAIVGAAYALAGHWEAFAFANFTSFFDRLPADVGRFNPDDRLYLAPLAILVIIGACATAIMRAPRANLLHAFHLFWLFASLWTAWLPSTVYRYYYAALVPAVMLAALPLLDRRHPGRMLSLAIVLAGTGFLLFLPRQYAQSQINRADVESLAVAIAPLVDSKDDCLWIFDGPTSLYRLTDSCLPTRFIYPDHLNNAFERYSLGVPQVVEVATILARKPPVIVTADTAFTPQNEEAKALVETTLARDYVEIASEELHERRIRAWARRDAPPR